MKYCLLALILIPFLIRAQALYQVPTDGETRWVSFENPTGEKGKAAARNNGAKGHPYDTIAPGQSRVILNFNGPAIIKRIWMTIHQRQPIVVRSMRIDIYWEHESKPAVSAPLGDFFGVGLGRKTAFQSALFSDPEGRSFNCIAEMPFRKNAKIVLTNESDRRITLFYEIDLLKLNKLPDDALYFHASWSRNNKTKLGEDFEVLPKISGKGRYLGANLGIITDTVYQNTWWGEGEMKIYLDGDSQWPSLASTGTEDYIGSGWSQGVYANLYQGCTIADEKNRQWTFYRYHIPDPVYFRKDCRVTIQQMGGDGMYSVRDKYKAGVPLIPLSLTQGQYDYHNNLFDLPDHPKITDPAFPDGWVNFFRKDNYSATAYFYLDKPTNQLPPLAPLRDRVEGILK